MILPFEVKNPYNSTVSYPVTNEEPEVLRKVLGTRKFAKAASICGGGEIPLLVLLPAMASGGTLTVVDHSRSSLSAAYLKAALLATYGPEITYYLLTEPLHNLRGRVSKVLSGFKAEIPKEISTAHFDNTGSYTLASVRNEWARTATISVLRKAYAKINTLKFVHGDITDLVDNAPFDLVYVSNCLGHRDRTGQYPKREVIESLVKPEGLVFGSSNSAALDAPLDTWKVLKEAHGYGRNGHSWKYYICKTPKTKHGVKPITSVAAV